MQFTTFTDSPALTLVWCLAGSSLTFNATAHGLSVEKLDVIQSTSQAANSDVQTPKSEIAGLGVPLSGGKLAGLRGGFDTVNNDMQLSGSVANNSATNVASGNNYIAGGSFANMTGLPITIQNSGSNVLIQNATIVNVQFQ